MASSGRALATLLSEFRDRIALTPDLQEKIAETDKPQSDEESKHWTATELKLHGLRIPFSPRVYGGDLWDRKKKRFHTPGCAFGRDNQAMDLEFAIANGFKPCESCGGVRFEVTQLELASKIDEIHRMLHDVRRFTLEDFDGLINLFEASRIMGCLFDKLEKDCRKAAREQLKDVKEDCFFQIHGDVNVLRYRENPTDRCFSFKFMRADCVRYARQYGRAAIQFFQPRHEPSRRHWGNKT